MHEAIGEAQAAQLGGDKCPGASWGLNRVQLVCPQ